MGSIPALTFLADLFAVVSFLLFCGIVLPVLALVVDEWASRPTKR